MSDQTIYVRASRQFVLDAIARIPQVASGGSSEAQSAQRALLVRLGITALGRIHSQFIVKAKGGTDDCGLKWPPLAPSTIAYSRRHPGVLWPGSRRAPYAPSWMLTAQQRKRWWSIYHGFGGVKPKGRAYHAKTNQYDDWAAARAWNILKSEGAKTLIGEYGNATSDINGPIQILRSTGLLLNTLSPPRFLADGGAAKIKDQVFRVGRGDVVVGTNRPWAGTHHEGNGRIPQRRLWPDPNQWTQSWWEDLESQAAEGLLDIAVFMLKLRLQRNP